MMPISADGLPGGFAEKAGLRSHREQLALIKEEIVPLVKAYKDSLAQNIENAREQVQIYTTNMSRYRETIDRFLESGDLTLNLNINGITSVENSVCPYNNSQSHFKACVDEFPEEVRKMLSDSIFQKVSELDLAINEDKLPPAVQILRIRSCLDALNEKISNYHSQNQANPDYSQPDDWLSPSPLIFYTPNGKKLTTLSSKIRYAQEEWEKTFSNAYGYGAPPKIHDAVKDLVYNKVGFDSISEIINKIEWLKAIPANPSEAESINFSEQAYVGLCSKLKGCLRK